MYSLNQANNHSDFSGSVNQQKGQPPRKVLRTDKACLVNSTEGFSPFNETSVFLHILSFLDIDNLGKSCFVNKLWKQLASDKSIWNLQRFFPSLRVIDKSAWKEHVDLDKWKLSFKGLASLNNNVLIPELKKFTSLSIEDNAGFTLLSVPSSLCCNTLVEIAKSLGQENTGFFRTALRESQYKAWSQVADTSYTVLLSNEILTESLDQTFAEQQKIVNDHECEMPSLLDLATLIVLTQRVDEKKLFQIRATSCSGVDSDLPMIFMWGTGGFRCYAESSDTWGCAALRKF
ncbi:MAG: hypothetical protein S4CHLAM123_14110 [Chlamydiales bacterium]|nr:hypothetical protein [Chlamydiales bacterium]